MPPHPTPPPFSTLHVAIDGPAGSGKSTVAARLAERLQLLHVDTGAMYRALTLAALRAGAPLDDGPRLARLLADARIGLEGGRTYWSGQDVEAAIRGPAVTAAVSQVSAHPQVRRVMVQRQRWLCWQAPRGAVLEGRDIGTVVLPLAQCKIYLDAAPQERARRRAAQAGLPTSGPELERLQGDIERRDALDSSRAASPLQVAPDAHVVDTTQLDLAAVILRCVELARAARTPPAPRAAMAGYRYRHAGYAICHRVIGSAVRLLVGAKVVGRDLQQVPEGLIYACNHISWFDPPVLGACLDREVWYLAKQELFSGLLGWTIARFNAIPIDRSRYDAKAFERATRVLAEGGSLVIFPEGTRRPEGQPGPIRRGLAVLLLRSERPYVPCYVRGTRALPAAILRRRGLEVWMGPPVRLHALAHLRAHLPEPELHARIGALFLQQLEALVDLAEGEP